MKVKVEKSQYNIEIDYSNYSFICLYDYVLMDSFKAIKLDDMTIEDYIRVNKLARKDVGVRALRFFGELNLVYMPSKINGFKLAVIGSYCFAPKSKLVEDDYDTDLSLIAGDLLLKAYLGANVEKIESFAFYNCRSLELLEMDSGLDKIDGDAFMNCSKIKRLNLRANLSEATGARNFLAQYKQGVLVSFKDKDRDEIRARFYYPEYSENIEEIGPAHIFSISVEGEGYRARQQFSDGVIDIGSYDDTFVKASALEGVSTLALMAVYRLLYPLGLNSQTKEIYENFILNNREEVIKEIVKKRDIDSLDFLLKSNLIDKRTKALALSLASRASWLEASAKIIKSGR